MAKLEFSHISKTFLSGSEAVKNFNLEIPDGEFLVIVGSSGCGKSTVLRMVAGLEEITTGELKINGEVANDWSPKKRNVAMVFQNYALFPNLTVEKNMEFALKMQKVPKQIRRERVLEMAKILGIEELLPKKPKKLSGGQCQRIAIGRALVCEPNIFLLDEPLSNLDAAMRTQLRGEIAELQKRLGITTLYVTHDQVEAMTLGDRVAVMHEGQIQQVDTPQNIYTRPQNVFVAQFTGSSTMNLLPVRCVFEQGETSLRLGDTLIPIPAWKQKALQEKNYTDKDVLLALRAEDIYPKLDGTAIPDTTLVPIEVQVDAIDVLGAEKKLHCSIGSAKLVTMARTYAETAIGDTITVLLATDQIHLFDAETELAIVH